MKENIHILIVDDNRDNLRVVSSFLKDKGYKLALALDGASALEILQTNQIDLILLDIMMPEMDGFQVCKIIKANPELKDIPVIFLTAKNQTEDVVTGFELGGVDYITKPFRKEELYVRVSNHLQLKMMRDYLKKELENTTESRNAFMRTLLDFGKTLSGES
jgi:two-component system, sensor histidine kinase and response regulator